MKPQERIKKLIADFLANRIEKDEFINAMHHKTITKAELLVHLVAETIAAKTTMPRVRFCWHCARKFQGNHFAEHQTENGIVYVHKDCKRILEGAFNHVRAVDDKGGAELAQKKVN